MSLLVTAVKGGDIELVQSLLSRQKNLDDLNIHQDGKTPLFYACENGFTDIVQLLISYKEININLKSTKESKEKGKVEELTPLQVAIEKDFTDIVQLLIDRSETDVNATLIKRSKETIKETF